MASIVLGSVGAFFGGPVGYMIGSYIGGLIDGPKGPDGPKLSDLKVQSSAYGTMIPIIYGTYRVAGNIIWATDLVEHASDAPGGKGGGPQVYNYTVSFAVSLGEGLIGGVRRIWADGKLVYDATPSAAGFKSYFKSNGYKFYPGSEDQLPDPTIQADKGVGNVPAYRGQAYWVFTDLQLEMFGNRIPMLSFEVVSSQTPIPHNPIFYGTGSYAALDPVTNYLWATYGDKIRIYDPIKRTLLHTITLPPINGTPAAAGGILYKGGLMVIGSDEPCSNRGMGWSVRTVDYSVTSIFFNVVDGNVQPSSYTWLGFPTVKGFFIAGNGLFTGNSYYPEGSAGPTYQGFILNYIATPDQSIDVIVGLLPYLDSTTGMPKVWFPGVSQSQGFPADRVVINQKARVLYWASSNYPNVYQVSVDTGVIIKVVDTTSISTLGVDVLLFDPDANRLYVSIGGTFYSYTPEIVLQADGALAYTPGETFPGLGIYFPNYPTALYVGQGVFSNTGSGAVVFFSFQNGFSANVKKIPLFAIVDDISQRCDLSATDSRELVDLVTGYCITAVMEAKAALTTLAQCFFFVSVESDGVIRFVKLGAAPSSSVPVADVILEGK